MVSEGGGVLLVVDDEPEIREIIALNAASLGMEVLEAGDGHQALEVVREHHVDVIVSDLMMPRVSGLTLLTSLREINWAKPFIFVTAYPSQDSTLKALRLGAFDYLEKPFEVEDLKALLTEALRVSRALGTLGSEPVAKGDPTQDFQKLRSLRYTDGKADGAGAGEIAEDGEADGVGEPLRTKPTAEDRARSVEHFVSEAVPQLLFCDGAIRALWRAEERAFELGYLFRVAQTLAVAAEKVEAKRIMRLAHAAEHLYTILRVKPRSVNETLVELAQRANDALRAEIDLFAANPVNTTVREQAFEQLILEIARATAALEPGRLRQAG